MPVAKMWADAQASAQKIIGKDGKLPKMSVDLDKLATDYNKALDDVKPTIKAVEDAWTDAKGKNDGISKGCDTLNKLVQGDDLGLDAKNPDQAKQQKAAKAVLSNALTSIKGVTFKNKQDNSTRFMKQLQTAMK